MFDGYYNRGLLYEVKGEFARALADFREALSFDIRQLKRQG